MGLKRGHARILPWGVRNEVRCASGEQEGSHLCWIFLLFPVLVLVDEGSPLGDEIEWTCSQACAIRDRRGG